MPRVARRRRSLRRGKRGYQKGNGYKGPSWGMQQLAHAGLRVAGGIAKNRLNKNPSYGRQKLAMSTIVGETGSKSSYSDVRKQAKWIKQWKRVGSFQVQKSVLGFRTATPQGRQSAVVTSPIFDQADIGFIQTDISQQKNAIAQYRRDADHIFLDSVVQKIMITNQANSNCHLKIYECLCRRDQNAPYTPVTAWSQGLIDENFIGTVLTPTATETDIGDTPFQSKMFSQMFKVKQVKQVYLASGQVHHHTVTYKPHRLFDTSRAKVNFVYGGLTHYTMFVCHGSPVNDTTGIVTTNAGAMDYVVSETTRYWQLEKSYTHYHRLTQLLPQTVVEKIMEDDGDAAPSVVQ